jgi:hypothetical protein
VVLVKKVQDQGRSREVVEIDRRFWKSEKEWYSHRAALAGRMLAWRAESPSALLQPESAAALARMDPNSTYISESESLEMQRCYQIAIFFWMYLNGISFNTSALIIRSNLLEMQYRLSNMDLASMSVICYTTLFNVLLAGTNAARGHPERRWFVARIVQYYPGVQDLDTAYHLLAEFYDSLSINFRVVEDIWDDIENARSAALLDWKHASSYGRQIVRPIKHFRPTSYTPDLSKPIRVLEIEDAEEDLVDKRLHQPSD